MGTGSMVDPHDSLVVGLGLMVATAWLPCLMWAREASRDDRRRSDYPHHSLSSACRLWGWHMQALWWLFGQRLTALEWARTAALLITSVVLWPAGVIGWWVIWRSPSREWHQALDQRTGQRAIACLRSSRSHPLELESLLSSHPGGGMAPVLLVARMRRTTTVGDADSALRIVAATEDLSESWEHLAPGRFTRSKDALGRVVLTRAPNRPKEEGAG